MYHKVSSFILCILLALNALFLTACSKNYSDEERADALAFLISYESVNRDANGNVLSTSRIQFDDMTAEEVEDTVNKVLELGEEGFVEWIQEEGRRILAEEGAKNQARHAEVEKRRDEIFAFLDSYSEDCYDSNGNHIGTLTFDTSAMSKEEKDEIIQMVSTAGYNGLVEYIRSCEPTAQ